MPTPIPLSRPKLFAAGVGVLMLIVSTGILFGVPAEATHRPANKMAVAGSSIEILSIELGEGEHSEVVELLRGTMKASNPTDLVIAVTAECALWTDVTTVGNDESEASASVKVWVEDNGAPVPVSSDDELETGKVVFCNRAYKQVTTLFDDEDATIEHFLRDRHADGFNWITLDVGHGLHEYVVKAQIDLNVEGTGMAKAAIGKRTLVVSPERLANDATI
jgi:hypothetical protein